MTYSGNSSLPPAVQDRVLSTFEQALNLYRQGRTAEVVAGCNLISQMDPTFEPARQLLQKVENPSLPIEVDALVPRTSGDPIQPARDAMAARDFQRVIHVTTEILTDDLLNDEARILGDQARDMLEASPFVEQFARKCDQLIAAGNLTAARSELEKARALDPTHPAVLRVASAIASRDSSAPASFVVDDSSSPSGRPPAQAADFGFSFEEEKSGPETFEGFSFEAPEPAPQEMEVGAFSFDTPDEPEAPAFANFSFDPAPEVSSASSDAPSFDFNAASIETAPDDQKKIDQYLADGDRAAAAGDHQQAIDLWSRIFLIDVTNEPASDRIERMKVKRREIDETVDPLLTSGLDAFGRGDTAQAHADFTEVLRIDPYNRSAQEHLERLGETIEGGGRAPVAPGRDSHSLDMLDDDMSSNRFDIAIPPSEAAPKTSERSKTARKAKPARALPVAAIAALLGLVVLGAAGWFAWTQYMRPATVDPATSQSVMARASALGDAGNFDQAIALLQDIKPTDPLHDKALVMISDLQQKKSNSAQMIDGVPAAQYYQESLEAARVAFEAHDYSTAKVAFEQAMRVRPLPDESKPAYDTAAEQVSKLGAATALFEDRKYEDAIASLQPLLEQDPRNQSVLRMIVDAHFNLGATALQQERTSDAIRLFEQVLELNPSDELARRSRDLATRYDQQPKDLLFRIYVRYLPLRKAQ
ncbi:MAG TPA: tetratricopeptide repeat protein [Thermoanaerobaculia bacterium]